MLIRIRRANLGLALRNVKNLGLCRLETVGTDRIGLAATDGIRSFRGLVPADIHEPGSFVLSSQTLLSVLDAMRVESVDIASDEHAVKIGDACTLALLSSAVIGEIPVCLTNAIATPLEPVKAAMDLVSHAATSDILSPLCGIEWRDGAIVAASSSAIALCKVPIPIGRALAVPMDIADYLPDAAAIAVDGDRIFWRAGESETSIRLPPHRFPSRLVDHVLGELSRPHWTKVLIPPEFLDEVTGMSRALGAAEAELLFEQDHLRARMATGLGTAEIKTLVEATVSAAVVVPVKHLVGPVDSVWVGGRGVFLTGATYTCYISPRCH